MDDDTHDNECGEYQDSITNNFPGAGATTAEEVGGKACWNESYDDIVY
jgi:hypothetical protein